MESRVEIFRSPGNGEGHRLKRRNRRGEEAGRVEEEAKMAKRREGWHRGAYALLRIYIFSRNPLDVS